ncbi:tripartite tricarboxylate transporter permease [Orrella marina]|uniref:C4-dicarboxylate ABC transporter permease n=1 Tax=Orrella marina TaxID=2163011 RepID=A0A2R4XG84_9BURK|nr:tripartite tricarboxylate transporter permease [Orrella marina]AWB32838.1 C4-dicarboxylate ABC transporter permease [Orrella marina]
MIDHILQALPALFSWDVFLSMLIGTIVGVVIGGLPGLSATMGIAVLIPLTFSMTPLGALGMIAGIYNGAMYGGAIPAILLRIPGTPAGIATVFDGHPMALKGQGRLALKIALYSSAIGGAVSAISLLLLAPPLASVALKFGSAEIFWLAMLGLTTIAVVLSSNPVKGLLSACFGLVMGLIGIDQMTGSERFTLDSMYLVGGVGILVLLTGLYAIPPAIDLAAKALLIRAEDLRRGDSGGREPMPWLRLLPTWCKSSVIGVLVGIVPGAGGNIASLLAWSEARRSSKQPETFGDGAPEGVAAAECANNADNASSLIPALTLGIPGNAVAAVILGGLLVHGLLPGPALFRDSAPVTYGFMLSMLVTSVLLIFVGSIGARLFISVLRLPALLLAPMIIAMTFIGIYSIGNSLFDVGLVAALGVLGYFMEKLGVPLAPAVLAVILGPMAESELRRSLLISQGNLGFLFSSPISLILVSLIIVMLCSPLIKRFLSRRTGKTLSEDIAKKISND